LQGFGGELLARCHICDRRVIPTNLNGIIPYYFVGKMAVAVDERSRVVIPKPVVEELELKEGDLVVFEKVGDDFVIRKLDTPKKRLEEVMGWNPKRTGKPEPVSPKEMKGIWKS